MAGAWGASGSAWGDTVVSSFTATSASITTATVSGTLTVPVLADSSRGAAGSAGRVIFNTDDANLNIDDGTNWILPDGTMT